jgi:hypothetical protein
MLKIALVAAAMFATVPTALAQSSYAGPGSNSFFGRPYGAGIGYAPRYTPYAPRPLAKAYKRTSSGQRGTRVIYGHPQRPPASWNNFAPMM